MKKLNRIASLVVLTVIGFSTYAQQMPMYTHYMYNTLVINPAYAGSRDALTVTALHRSQWVGFEGAPTTQTLTLHAPLTNQKIGLGLAVMNDKIGPINNSAVSANFAYMMQLNRSSKLALGLSGGVNMFKANLSKLNLDQQNDPIYLNNINNKITPDFGFGAYYSRERFYTGVSVPNLLQNTYSNVKDAKGTTVEGKEQRHYFLIAGTMLKLGSNLAFKPTTLVKVTSGVPIQADLTAAFVISDVFLLGAMFRSNDAIGVLVGFDIAKQLHLGYSYDWSYGLKSSTYNNGSHEIVLRYDFLLNNKKQIHSPRYF